MANATTPRIAVLGAGHVGPGIARLALDARHSVAIAARATQVSWLWSLSC
jgi:predicted dinucleotide-binding enzyme